MAHELGHALGLNDEYLRPVSMSGVSGAVMFRAPIVPRWQQRRDPNGRNDLVVLVDVTNTGPRAVRLSAFLHAPGLIPRRQQMAPLEPGVTTTQSFLIQDGADLLSETTIFVGVEDPEDASRLIAEVELP